MGRTLQVKKILWVFNLETNLDSPVLAATHDWITELSNRYEEVNVYSTHIGRTALPRNVILREIGGGNLKNRVRGFFRLLGAVAKIGRRRRISAVFHHMNSKSAFIIGLPIRILRVPQILWYSHSVPSPELWAAEKFVNNIVTTFPGSYPRQSKKVSFIGHGIQTSNFVGNGAAGKREIDLVSVGRIAEIKNLDKALIALAEAKKSLKFNPVVEFIGPAGNLNYKQHLITIAENNSINLRIESEVNYSKIAAVYSKSSIYYTGTPKSVDKATLEAAMCGCLIVSDNKAVHFLTGMREVWVELGFEKIPEISVQIGALMQLSESLLPHFRALVSKLAKERNNLTNTISRIKEILEENE